MTTGAGRALLARVRHKPRPPQYRLGRICGHVTRGPAVPHLLQKARGQEVSQSSVDGGPGSRQGMLQCTRLYGRPGGKDQAQQSIVTVRQGRGGHGRESCRNDKNKIQSCHSDKKTSRCGRGRRGCESAHVTSLVWRRCRLGRRRCIRRTSGPGRRWFQQIHGCASGPLPVARCDLRSVVGSVLAWSVRVGACFAAANCGQVIALTRINQAGPPATQNGPSRIVGPRSATEHAMGPPGRPKGKQRSAQHEGTP